MNHRDLPALAHRVGRNPGRDAASVAVLSPIPLRVPTGCRFDSATFRSRGFTLDLGDQPVASTGNVLNESRRMRIIAERLAQLGDGLIHDVVHHNDVRPNPIQQRGSRYYRWSDFGQRNQNIHRLSFDARAIDVVGVRSNPMVTKAKSSCRCRPDLTLGHPTLPRARFIHTGLLNLRRQARGRCGFRDSSSIPQTDLRTARPRQ